jgi:3-dehydrotetronate 4-kinase
VSGLKLGCIADDFTGATDLANNLVRAGMRVRQLIGVPVAEHHALNSGDVDAIVIALKSRTTPAEHAVAESLAACDWLCAQGAAQLYFKYCSTFDSTPAGNIGPVIEALLVRLQTSFTIATPAFPENQRSVYMGHLFVGDVLLSESGMRDHPLTPMTDANLVRVLQAQSQSKVGAVLYPTVAQGAGAIRADMNRLQAAQVSVAIVDAISNADLMQIGLALKDMRLVTGGSGVAIGLPQNWNIYPNAESTRLPAPHGRQAIVSGSCSRATNAQVAHFIASGAPAYAIDAMQIAEGLPVVDEVLAWAQTFLGDTPILIYSTAEPTQLRAIQAELGAAHSGTLVEDTLAAIVHGLVRSGVGQLIVAGGETSGACVKALDITSMQIGPQIDPGVPWCFAHSAGGPVHLTLKSGNFGTNDFFTKAFRQLQ